MTIQGMLHATLLSVYALAFQESHRPPLRTLTSNKNASLGHAFGRIVHFHRAVAMPFAVTLGHDRIISPPLHCSDDLLSTGGRIFPQAELRSDTERRTES